MRNGSAVVIIIGVLSGLRSEGVSYVGCKGKTRGGGYSQDNLGSAFPRLVTRISDLPKRRNVVT